LQERLIDRSITLSDLYKLQAWVNSRPEVPEDDWYKDFGTFKICGTGDTPTTFLDSNQVAWGHELGESEKTDA
jgi:hypothetical protein